LSFGRTIGSPSLQPNARANAAMFESGPFDPPLLGCMGIHGHARAELLGTHRGRANSAHSDKEALLGRVAVDQSGPPVPRQPAFEGVVADE